MAWWQPKEEASPQSRVGASPRVGATSQPVEGSEPVRPIHEVQAQSPASDPQTWVPPVRRVHVRRFPAGLGMGIFALLFVAAFVVPIVLVFTSLGGEDGIGGTGGFGGFGGTGSHDGPSLVKPDRFESAMGKVQDRAGPEASLAVLRVAPERINAIVRAPGGKRTTISVQPDLSVTTLPAGIAGSERGVSMRKIDPALPQRLARRAAVRLRTRPADLDYMALTAIESFGGGGSWSIFFDGRLVIADLDGSNLRVPGE